MKAAAMKLAANQRRAICGICPAGCWIIEIGRAHV